MPLGKVVEYNKERKIGRVEDWTFGHKYLFILSHDSDDVEVGQDVSFGIGEVAMDLKVYSPPVPADNNQEVVSSGPERGFHPFLE